MEHGKTKRSDPVDSLGTGPGRLPNPVGFPIPSWSFGTPCWFYRETKANTTKCLGPAKGKDTQHKIYELARAPFLNLVPPFVAERDTKVIPKSGGPTPQKKATPHSST